MFNALKPAPFQSQCWGTRMSALDRMYWQLCCPWSPTACVGTWLPFTSCRILGKGLTFFTPISLSLRWGIKWPLLDRVVVKIMWMWVKLLGCGCLTHGKCLANMTLIGQIRGLECDHIQSFLHVCHCPTRAWPKHHSEKPRPMCHLRPAWMDRFPAKVQLVDNNYRVSPKIYAWFEKL